jgi:hypothetical protein
MDKVQKHNSFKISSKLTEILTLFKNVQDIWMLALSNGGECKETSTPLILH